MLLFFWHIGEEAVQLRSVSLRAKFGSASPELQLTSLSQWSMARLPATRDLRRLWSYSQLRRLRLQKHARHRDQAPRFFAELVTLRRAKSW